MEGPGNNYKPTDKDFLGHEIKKDSNLKNNNPIINHNNNPIINHSSGHDQIDLDITDKKIIYYNKKGGEDEIAKKTSEYSEKKIIPNLSLFNFNKNLTDEELLKQFFDLDNDQQIELLLEPENLERIKKACENLGPLFIPSSFTKGKLNLAQRVALINGNEAVSIMEIFYSHKEFDLEMKTEIGSQLIHIAAFSGNQELIKSLKKQGADPFATRDDDSTPFDLVDKSKQKKLTEALLEGIDVIPEEFCNKCIAKLAKSDSLQVLIEVLSDSIAHYGLGELSKKAFREFEPTFFKSPIEDLAKQVIIKTGKLHPEFEHFLPKVLGNCLYGTPEDDDLKALKVILESDYLFLDEFFLRGAVTTTLPPGSKTNLDPRIENLINPWIERIGSNELKALKHLLEHCQPPYDTYNHRTEEFTTSLNVLKEAGWHVLGKGLNELENAIKIQDQASKILTSGATAANMAEQAQALGDQFTEKLLYIACKSKNNALSAELLRLLAPQIHNETKNASKLISNAVLDKAFSLEKKALEGGFQSITAPYLAASLRVAQEDPIFPNLFPGAEKTVQSEINSITTELEKMATIHFLRKSMDGREGAQKISQDLQELSIGESMLIPVESQNHATLMRVQRTSNENTQVTFYNTGGGISLEHPVGKTEDHYQTHIAFNNVPLKDLIDTSKWPFLISHQVNQTKDMQKIYDHILKFCENGKRIAPSEHEEHYEAIQKSGSCAYQCQLAMLRERLVNLEGVSPEEGFSIYKLVKGRVMHAYKILHEKEIQPFLKNPLEAKIKMIGAEENIFTSLANPESKKKIVAILTKLCNQNNLNELAEKITLYSDLSIFQLHRSVHAAVKALSKRGCVIEGDNLVTKLIQLRKSKQISNWILMREGLNSMLKKPEESIELFAQTFGGQLLGGPYQDEACTWFANTFTAPKPGVVDEKNVLMDRLIKGIRKRPEVKKRREILDPLIQVCIKCNNNILGVYLIGECLKEQTTEYVHEEI